MTKYILVFLFVIFDITSAMSNPFSGQFEPDRDFVLRRDSRTKNKALSIQSTIMDALQYYAKSTNMAKIVAFSGGGVRGIGPASICANIEHVTKKSMADMFHMFSGTSTGAIIATGLTMQDPHSEGGKSLYSAEDIVNLYSSECKTIFTPRSLLGSFFVSKYKTKPAYQTFEKLFKNVKLSDIRPDCDLLIPYYNLTNNRTGFFKSHKARNIALARTQDFYLKDVIASTTAAPTYFKAFRLNTVHNKEHSKISRTNYIYAVDGGIATNDPALCALTEAMSIYSNADAFLLVSMGTGHCVSEVHPKGLLGWAKNISTVLMDNSSDMTSHMLEKFGMHSNKPVFFSRLQFDISKTYEEMDNTSQDNLSYLEHQALSTDSILTKTKKLTAILKESDKVDRPTLIGDSPNKSSNFIEI